MNILLWTIYIIFSLLIGSFLNVVALRVPKQESIIFPPSHCPACNHRLSMWDLVPIFSYLFLKGKCRYCQTKISWLYPFGELITLLIFISIPLIQGFSKELIIAYPFMIILIIATISDLKYHIIPNVINYLGMILFLILRLLIHPFSIWNFLIGGVIGGGILLLLAIVSKGGMGGGDIKLFIVIGLVLGWQNTILALFVSSTIGSIIGFLLIIFGKVKRKQMIPYGPFIALGSIITYFFGNTIWSWYLSLF